MNTVSTSLQNFDTYPKQFHVVIVMLTILTSFAKRTSLNAILQNEGQIDHTTKIEIKLNNFNENSDQVYI